MVMFTLQIGRNMNLMTMILKMMRMTRRGLILFLYMQPGAPSTAPGFIMHTQILPFKSNPSHIFG